MTDDEAKQMKRNQAVSVAISKVEVLSNRTFETLSADDVRYRAALAAFQSGRPVFANTEGEMRYVDGDCEPVVGAAGGLPMAITLARPSLWARIWRRIRGRRQ
jgi:hypothetical protein